MKVWFSLLNHYSGAFRLVYCKWKSKVYKADYKTRCKYENSWPAESVRSISTLPSYLWLALKNHIPLNFHTCGIDKARRYYPRTWNATNHLINAAVVFNGIPWSFFKIQKLISITNTTVGRYNTSSPHASLKFATQSIEPKHAWKRGHIHGTSIGIVNQKGSSFA